MTALKQQGLAIAPLALWMVVSIFTMAACGFFLTRDVSPPAPLPMKHVGAPEFLQREIQARIDAPVEVALIFGRATGCQDAEPWLIRLVAREAIRAGVNPKVLAATVAVESGCDPLAVSPHGALGLTQVLARVWKSKFDFSRVNLLNADDNVRTGAAIMAGLIREKGLRGGVQLYNGASAGCPNCDQGYSERVLALAGLLRPSRPRMLDTQTMPPSRGRSSGPAPTTE